MKLQTPLLSATHLSKSFGILAVVRNINLEIHPGEVVGITGQSGSGKSTLAMLLAGLHQPDEGQLHFSGRQLHRHFRARDMEIEVIHQTPSLAENLDITSNIFLGNEIGVPFLGKWLKIPNRPKMDQEAARILEQLDFNVKSLRLAVAHLTSDQRQMIAIARTLTHSPSLIIIDDPTRLLSFPNQQKLLALIQWWQKQGIAVVFSSSNLDHLMAVTDRIVVLRKGMLVAEYRTDETDREEILAKMVGTKDHQQLTPIIWALDSYYRAREHAETIRHSRSSLEKDLVAKEPLNQQFLDQLTEQITVLDSANLALQDAQRRLLSELEQDRKHLAREIHDQIIQDILSINYQLEEIESEEDISSELKEFISEIRVNNRRLVEGLRNICGSLRPPTIDSLGLGAAIQSFVHEFTHRTQIPVALNIDQNLGRLPETIELSVFRIVQEGLRNVRKHAGASAAAVGLRHTTPRSLMISIADDGEGLKEDFDLYELSSEDHYGLLGISERVALLGGRLKLLNQESGGLLMQAEIPHPRVRKPDELE